MDLGLIYVVHIGTNVNGLNEYQFLFSDDPDGVFGDDWAVQPVANSNVTQPELDHISEVRTIKTERVLIPAQDNSCFSYQDCKDQIYAVCYEDITTYDEYPDVRLVFHYGESLSEVTKKFMEVGISFED